MLGSPSDVKRLSLKIQRTDPLLKAVTIVILREENMRKWTIGFLIFGMLALPTMGFAVSPWAESGTYSEQATGKFKFGFKNLFLGWTELFTEPQEAQSEGRNFIQGLGQGVVNFVLDTAGGVLHLVTFPITQIDIPLPENGISI